jgi:hypothetical protein
MRAKREALACVDCGRHDTPLWVRMDQVRRGQPVPWRCLDCYLWWLAEHPPRGQDEGKRA